MKKTKKDPKTISRRKSRYIITLCLIFVIGAIAGLAGSLLLRNHNQTILVWRADKTVRVPDGLVSYLEKHDKNDCHDYKGTNSVTGVATFAIYESSQNRLAKMSYGCSTNMDKYLVAYKEDGKWNLTRPTHYFVDLKWPASDGPTQAPACEFLDQHNIPGSFEQYCVDSTGALVNRTL